MTHFYNGSENVSHVSTETNFLLKVKISKLHKSKEQSVNVDWTFSPFVNVFFLVDTPHSSLCDPDEHNVNISDDEDKSFVAPSEGSSISNDEDDDIDVVNRNLPDLDNKFLVFWSYILPLLTFCQKCFSKA